MDSIRYFADSLHELAFGSKLPQNKLRAQSTVESPRMRVIKKQNPVILTKYLHLYLQINRTCI
jgi:hypothetical protein